MCRDLPEETAAVAPDCDFDSDESVVVELVSPLLLLLELSFSAAAVVVEAVAVGGLADLLGEGAIAGHAGISSVTKKSKLPGMGDNNCSTHIELSLVHKHTSGTK